jgi:hypothetical protein
MEKDQRLIVVSNGAGSTYIGCVDVYDLASDVHGHVGGDKDLLKTGPILLKGARLLSVVTLPKEVHGQLVLSQITKVLAMPACSGPIDMYILPTMWFWPDQDQPALQRLLSLLNGAEQEEKEQRLANSGLVAPGRGKG